MGSKTDVRLAGWLAAPEWMDGYQEVCSNPHLQNPGKEKNKRSRQTASVPSYASQVCCVAISPVFFFHTTQTIAEREKYSKDKVLLLIIEIKEPFPSIW